jgi:hypothetical protein
MPIDGLSMAAIWGAVILSGIYHGLNPGMGWPLAVSAALIERRHAALPKALGLLAAGHFLSMLAVLLPFSLMIFLVAWDAQIRAAAGLTVIAMGVYLLVNPRHPRFLARVRPARLALWSFLAALAHGAGLMLVPIFLGICAVQPHDAGHEAVAALMGSDVGIAFAVAALHTLAMTLAGAVIAVFIYYWLSLKFLPRIWFNLDTVWAVSLVLVGAFGLYSATQGH